MKLNRRKRKPKTPPPANSLLLTIPEAGDILRVSRGTIYNLATKKELDLVHVGAAARITRASVERRATPQCAEQPKAA
jgi:excisionase family DNA binding protein